MAALLGLLALVKQAFDFSSGQVVGIALLGFLLLLGAEILFIWYLVRSPKGAQTPGDESQPKAPTTSETQPKTPATSEELPGGIPMNTQCEPQTIRRSAVSRRVDSLFKAMSTDFLLREQFVTEPTQVLAEYVHGTRLSPEQAAASDQLLYSVASNQKLLGWLRDYSIKNKGVLPPRDRYVRDFSRAVVASGSYHVVLALAKSSAEKQDIFDPFESFLQVVFGTFAGNLGNIHAQTEMSTGHTTGTEMSTGHIFAQTEMSTGHTTGTEMSTGHIFAQTEMSTGHTTGTEMSTGHIFGQEVFRVGYQRVTLLALAEYATRLRDAGALDAF
ncbi:MAG: hypothetical protein ABW208_18735 [Pyrinomonadaceae bacterium]